MRKITLILLPLLLTACAAVAEIPCICSEEACICFIQLGDEGPAVEYIRQTLAEQGYLPSSNGPVIFDEPTRQAIIRFQKEHDLPATDMMDDETLTLLLWGMLPTELDEHDPFSNSNAIWIPTDGGIRRHWKSGCCKMHDPRRVSVRNADMMNMLPCGLCNRNGAKELTGDAP